MTLTRGVGFREDFLNVTSWTADAGVTATTDGDILSLTGTTATTGFSRSVTALGTTFYPKLIIRGTSSGSGIGSIDLVVTFSDASTQTLIFNPGSGSTIYQTITYNLTGGKTLSTIKFQNQTLSVTWTIDFVFVFKETLTLPAVSQPLQVSLPRYLVELPIPTREGGVLQDLGSQSAQLDVAGTLVTTSSPNNYTGEQWWDVLVGTWLEANWQWLTSDRVTYKYQIQEFTGRQDPGRVGYYEFKMRLKKVDILTATAQTFGAIQ